MNFYKKNSGINLFVLFFLIHLINMFNKIQVPKNQKNKMFFGQILLYPIFFFFFPPTKPFGYLLYFQRKTIFVNNIGNINIYHILKPIYIRTTHSDFKVFYIYIEI